VIRGAKAAASQHAAAEAADATLAGGAGAVDAVIAGFLGAAGAEPGVLFAPAVAIVAGFGAGARAFDGRAAQPGRGAPRPRGFVDDAAIPDGARVAAPRTLGMLALLHSYRGRSSFSALARAGVAAADSAGAKKRAAMVRKVGSAGVLALRAPEVVRALLAAGGPVAGGALTEADLAESAPAETDAAVTPIGDGLTAYTSPFAAPSDARGDAEVVVACDGRGVIAALAYVPAKGGVPLPDLELAMGRDAVPVRRGVTRVAPGTVLPMAAPIGIAVHTGTFAAAVGLPGRAALEAAALAELVKGVPVETALADLRAHLGGHSAVAVITDGKTARAATV
jgi:gamma-glutamyltranspeptidase/glutathione hydrolase